MKTRHNLCCSVCSASLGADGVCPEHPRAPRELPGNLVLIQFRVPARVFTRLSVVAVAENRSVAGFCRNAAIERANGKKS